MLVVFLALIVGPLVARKYLKGLPTIPMNLLQPTGQNNNDTSSEFTGTALVNFGSNGGAATGAAGGGASGGGGGGGGGSTAAAAPTDGFNFGDGGFRRMIF